jgi:hypothetical protein
MPFEFRPEFRIDFHLDVVWPKLKGAFRGLGAALKGLVLPGAESRGGARRRGGRGRSRRRARLVGWCLAALLVALALALAFILPRR